ncbi:hypothetical protein [Streptomyces radicis]|uniref:hypothetical protein n=1 Tax=Streptomyces radicis TaxID=1750517 RepID=UPI001601AB31|nr:hypothetical protein [Streptomyces radicis]
MARIAARTGTARPERRHPLVATAMVLPLALVLAVAIGGVEAVMTQASSVAGMLGR